jgi:hypothetical protein
VDTSGQTAQDEPPLPFRELIVERQGGRTLRHLEADSQYTDGAGNTVQVLAQRWHQFLNRPLKQAPDFATIPAIAKALGVSVREVWTAIGQQGGLDLRRETLDDSALVARLRPGVRDLPDSLAAALAHVANEAAEALDTQSRILSRK